MLRDIDGSIQKTFKFQSFLCTFELLFSKIEDSEIEEQINKLKNNNN